MWQKIKELPSETKALLLMLCLCVLSVVAGYFQDSPPPLSKKEFTAPPPITGTISVPKESITLPAVRVYKKKEIAKKVDLPKEVLADDKKEVTATAELPPTKGGAEVISVIDEAGNTKIYAKEKPLPFFQFIDEKRIGAGYGITTKGQQAKVYGEWSFLRVGSMHLGIQGEANSLPEAKVFAVIDYRF